MTVTPFIHASLLSHHGSSRARSFFVCSHLVSFGQARCENDLRAGSLAAKQQNMRAWIQLQTTSFAVHSMNSAPTGTLSRRDAGQSPEIAYFVVLALLILRWSLLDATAGL